MRLCHLIDCFRKLPEKPSDDLLEEHFESITERLDYIEKRINTLIEVLETNETIF